MNRLLNDEEKLHHLKQGQRLALEPQYQLSVIKLNSSYLESVDKWFGWKGILTAFAIIVITIFACGFLGIVYVTLTSPSDLRPANDGWWICTVIAIMIFPVIAAAIWLLKKEAFAYTHYPIRFDRKNQMVYVFRKNGTVASVRWDAVFFTLGHMPQWNEWEVRGHILESDKVTVRETFALSYVGSIDAENAGLGGANDSSKDLVRAHWEFIRRYMEDGPQDVIKQIQFCMPVDKRKEAFRVGAERVFANFAGAPFLVYWIMFPLCLGVSVFRWIAMRTSKVPQWPSEVEASCMVEPNDPYAIKGTPTGERTAVFPKAALDANVYFCIPSRS
ncbi:DUF6708 domain-containing protein [Massilia suwonensis]|uniref:DUF6708 domain-containing protein n=1 Tax=Massilia suwonensis TaxID=648895 RepID=A0ABW0MGA5_9BURK